MTIRRSPPTEDLMTVDALLRRIKQDVNEIKRRGCSAALKKCLAGELEDLTIETLAATPGGLDNYPIDDDAHLATRPEVVGHADTAA